MPLNLLYWCTQEKEEGWQGSDGEHFWMARTFSMYLIPFRETLFRSQVTCPLTRSDAGAISGFQKPFISLLWPDALVDRN